MKGAVASGADRATNAVFDRALRAAARAIYTPRMYRQTLKAHAWRRIVWDDLRTFRRLVS